MHFVSHIDKDEDTTKLTFIMMFTTRNTKHYAKVAAVLSLPMEGADRRHQKLFRREDRALLPLARALHHLVGERVSVQKHGRPRDEESGEEKIRGSGQRKTDAAGIGRNDCTFWVVGT